ncbi:hypothetical protein BU26DRAFT_190831 [Trematosphaeria pertusa]|uniref:Uncharacterized protein n=1 Tax=Trematosphaeria pertusa TaxID=390896 RepID=A0A6A6HRM9_9PLEO|nr:uncharacterized protein BU26DRAFT_190831 [Trematosphaeria pertusa]KAF2240805.1 hypothetical protein BU26DRAFT_190831 [Trematosphaeria pertusa]
MVRCLLRNLNATGLVRAYEAIVYVEEHSNQAFALLQFLEKRPLGSTHQRNPRPILFPSAGHGNYARLVHVDMVLCTPRNPLRAKLQQRAVNSGADGLGSVERLGAAFAASCEALAHPPVHSAAGPAMVDSWSYMCPRQRGSGVTISRSRCKERHGRASQLAPARQRPEQSLLARKHAKQQTRILFRRLAKPRIIKPSNGGSLSWIGLLGRPRQRGSLPSS